MRPERQKTVRPRRDVPGRLRFETLEARAVPALVVNPIAAVAGVQLNMRIAEFAVGDVTAPVSPTAAVDWGDGRSGPASVVPITSSTYGVIASTTFPNAGTFAVKVTVTGGADSTKTAAGEAVVSPAVGAGDLIPTATSIAAVVGQPFRGAAATFSDPTAGAKASDYTATIQWEGATSTATAGTVVADSAGNFHVEGDFTYATTGPKFVVTTIRRTRDGAVAQTTSAAQVAAALRSSTPTPATATAGSPFTGPLLRFSSAPESGAASDYGATIDWGDGTTGAGTIAATAGATADAPPAYLTVHGTHIYTAAGPYTVTIRVEQAGGGEPITAKVPMTAYAFTGGLDSGSLVGTAAGVSVTNQTMPVLSGTAEPGAIVALTMRRLGGGDPVGVADVIADASGRWSQTVGPMGGAFLLYGGWRPLAADAPERQPSDRRGTEPRPHPGRRPTPRRRPRDGDLQRRRRDDPGGPDVRRVVFGPPGRRPRGRAGLRPDRAGQGPIHRAEPRPDVPSRHVHPPRGRDPRRLVRGGPGRDWRTGRPDPTPRPPRRTLRSAHRAGPARSLRPGRTRAVVSEA